MTGSDTSQSRDERAAELLAVLADSDATDAQRQTARDSLIAEHVPLVRYCANKFAGRGEALEDLVQVGVVGLIKAVDRFDVSRGAAFASFATPTIIGEIRRHLRDRTSLMRLPRGLAELSTSVAVTTGELTGELGRSPTPTEIATRLGVELEDVLEALEARHAGRVASLDSPTVADERTTMGERIADTRDDMELVDQLATLAPLLRNLPERERRILELRFGREMSQSEIASRMGISQMHVSRLLTKTLDALRTAARPTE